jgi:acetyltransferase
MRQALAMDMIKATRIARLLQGFRYVPPVDLDSIGKALIAVSQIAIDFPFVRALDINPMLAGDQSLVVLDARIEIDLAMMHAPAPNRRLVIRPYPVEWSREIALAGRRFTLRPIRPLDANSYAALLRKTTEDDLRMRFLGWTKPSNATIIRMTHIDYEREMAFVAVDDTGELVGVARLVIDAGGEWGEFGLLVRSDKQRIGLGVTLLQHLRAFAAEEGLKEVRGSVLASNDKMLGLCRKLEGDITSSRSEPGLKQVRLSALVTGYQPRKECVAPR